jgi:hypothetical protein
MAELHLTVNDQERECLRDVLTRALKETRVEEHRTRGPNYREHLVEQERCIAGLLDKLGQPLNA